MKLMEDEGLIVSGEFWHNLTSDEVVVDEEFEFLWSMDDEDVLVMGILVVISISDEAFVDKDVELDDSGEGTDMPKLFSILFFFMKMPTVPEDFDDPTELPDLTDSWNDTFEIDGGRSFLRSEYLATAKT